MKRNLFIIFLFSSVFLVTSKEAESSTDKTDWIFSNDDSKHKVNEKIPEDIREMVDLERNVYPIKKSEYPITPLRGQWGEYTQPVNFVKLPIEGKKFINMPSFIKNKEGDLYPSLGEGYEAEDGRRLQSLIWYSFKYKLADAVSNMSDLLIDKEIENAEEDIQAIDKRLESEKSNSTSKKDLTDERARLKSLKRRLQLFKRDRSKSSIPLYTNTGWFVTRIADDIYLMWNSKGPERYYLRKQVDNIEDLPHFRYQKNANEDIESFVYKTIHENQKRKNSVEDVIYEWADESSGVEATKATRRASILSHVKTKSAWLKWTSSSFRSGFVMQSLELESAYKLEGKDVVLLNSLFGFSSGDLRNIEKQNDITVNVEEVKNNIFYSPPLIEKFANQLKMSPMEWIRKEYLPKIAQLSAEQHYKGGFIKLNDLVNTVAVIDEGKIVSFIIRGSYGLVDLAKTEKISKEFLVARAEALSELILVNGEFLPQSFAKLFVKEYLQNYAEKAEEITGVDMSHLKSNSLPSVNKGEVMSSYSWMTETITKKVGSQGDEKSEFENRVNSKISKIKEENSSSLLGQVVPFVKLVFDVTLRKSGRQLDQGERQFISYVKENFSEVFDKTKSQSKNNKGQKNSSDCKKSFLKVAI